MKKEDLRTGMSVRLRNGAIYSVLVQDCMKTYNYGNQQIILFNAKLALWKVGSNYTETLNNIEDSRHDIVSVYADNEDLCFNCDTFIPKRHEYLIWERPKVVEMTLEQVCKALGKEIKIIK